MAGLVLVGCAGGGEVQPPAASTLPIAPGLFEATWPLEVTKAEARAPYEQEPWVQLTFHRDYKKAVAYSQGTPGLATARAHADSAALYRQAALAAGQAYVEYFEPPLGQSYDPAEKVHLILVGKAFGGDIEGARAQIAAVRALPAEAPTAVWSAPWTTWLDAGATWPPDFASSPFQPPPVAPGQWPEVVTRPSYALKELEPGTNALNVDDPTMLLQIALWHDAAAKQAAGPSFAGALDVYGARYRLKAEGPVAARDDLPLELRFGSDFAHPKDGAFLAAATGSDGPAAAIAAMKETSFLAAVAHACLAADGKLDSVKVVDLVSSLRKAWKEEQGKLANATEAHHPIFADVAVAGTYRSLALVAEAMGDRETSGKLRITAKDVELDAAGAPEGLMALTAWDADNQYTMRGSEIIHQQTRRDPSLEVVRTAFDVLAIRVSRASGAGGTPGM
jgi:hypothetical protein